MPKKPITYDDDNDNDEANNVLSRIYPFLFKKNVVLLLCISCVIMSTFKFSSPSQLRLLQETFFDDTMLSYTAAFGSASPSTSTSTQQQQQYKHQYTKYIPAPVEEYIMNHTKELDLEKQNPLLTTTCHIWENSTITPYHKQLIDFISELENYFDLINKFKLPNNVNKDIRKNITITSNDNNNNIDHSVCELLKLHPNGLPGIFNNSQQLSFTRTGWVEPLLPSMRHPKYCLEGDSYLMNIQYILHDFYSLCLSLKPTSKTIFIDMGASLSFHKGQQSPVFDLIDIFSKFGFIFDHVYAYELTKQDPNHVMSLVPQHVETSFHWINVGVNSNLNHKHNPFRLILDNFNQDDMIIVKLDIDALDLEREFANQLRNSTKLAQLIDHFYFEHHNNQEELFKHWRRTKESVYDSMQLFRQLREQGIAAHFWV